MTTTPTILAYVLTPTSVNANTRANFTLVVSNGSTPLQLTPNDEIYLAIPVGTSATDLTVSLDDVSTQAPDAWRFSKFSDGGASNFIISPTQNVTINASAALVFELNAVIVNLTAGSASVVLNEYIGSHVGQLSTSISKSEAVLSIVAQAIPSTVGKNQTTILKWTSAKAAYVTIQPLDKQVDTVGQLVTTPSRDLMPGASQVSYSFTAWTPDQQFARDIVVVTISGPVITSFEPQHQAPVGYDDQITLRWDVAYAETVFLVLPQGPVQKPARGELLVQPKTMLQGNANSATYTLRATGAGNPVFGYVVIPFQPVRIDYFRYPAPGVINAYAFCVTNGMSQIDQLSGPQGQYFQLTATGPDGPLVQYLGNYPALQIQLLYLSSTTVSAGTMIQLQWQTVYAVSWALTANGVPVSIPQSAGGSIPVTPMETTTYVLSASDANGKTITSTNQVTVTTPLILKEGK